MEFIFANKVQGLRPSTIREIFKMLGDPDVIPFAAGNPSPLSFPVEKFSLLSQSIFEENAAESLQYGITEGYAPLRRQIFERLKEQFSIGQDYDETIVTSGGQQGIDLVCKALCNEGDVILCENPSFIGALNAFRSHGAALRGIDMGEDGISLTHLEHALRSSKNVSLIYLIPTFQNPSGITMSLEKRKAVLALAKQYGVPILEDNPYGELRFAGRDIPTIKSLDQDGHVVYCGSLSKVLSPGMRVGFLCGPKELIQKVVVLKQTNDVHTNLFFQMLCSRFISVYGLDGHISKIKELYGGKCALMLSEMDKLFPKGVKYTRPQGGLFLWCMMPPRTDMKTLFKKMLDAKVAVVPGSAFLPDVSNESYAFRLNYSMPSDGQIKKGIQIIAGVMKSVLTNKNGG